MKSKAKETHKQPILTEKKWKWIGSSSWNTLFSTLDRAALGHSVAPTYLEADGRRRTPHDLPPQSSEISLLVLDKLRTASSRPHLIKFNDKRLLSLNSMWITPVSSKTFSKSPTENALTQKPLPHQPTHQKHLWKYNNNSVFWNRGAKERFE